MKKSLFTIYVFYHKKGILEDYSKYYLSALREISSFLLVVINGDINKDGWDFINSISDKVIIRENKGFDIWAYREGFLWARDRLSSYDQLLMTNGTVYGPIYCLESVFDQMIKKNYDFWGITKHPEQNIYLIQERKEGYIYEHVQTYFLVTNQKMFLSDEFAAYWNEIPAMETKNDAVALHEVFFTKHFEDLGFRSGSYIDVESFIGRCNNPYSFVPDELLAKNRLPLLKTQSLVFSDYEQLLTYSFGGHSSEVLSFIRSNTDYDEGLIWKNLLSNCPLSKIRTQLNLFRIVDVEKNRDLKKDKKLKLLFLIFIDKSTPVDLLISKIRKIRCKKLTARFYYCKSEIDRDTFAKQTSKLNCEYIELENDKNPILDIFKDISIKQVSSYDYCFYYAYQGRRYRDLSIGDEDNTRQIIETALSSDALSVVEDSFEKEPYLGLINVSIPFSFAEESYLSEALANQRDILRQMHYDLLLSIPFDEDEIDFNYSSGWLNSKSLSVAVSFFSQKRNEDIIRQLPQSELYFLPRIIQADHSYPLELSSVKSLTLSTNNEKLFFEYFKETDKKPSPNQYNYFDSREELIASPFRIGELLKIVFKYPLHKYRSITKKNSNDHNSMFSYAMDKKPVCLSNVTIENGRLLLYFTSVPEHHYDLHLNMANKNYYPLPDSKMNDLQKRLTAYQSKQKNYCVFYELPLDSIKNKEISMHDVSGKKIPLVWTGCISFNALELKDIHLYMRITNGTIHIEDKKEFCRAVIKDEAYSLQDKLLFLLNRINPFHFLTIFAENHSAADNSYQLFKEAINRHERVRFVASRKTIESQSDPAIRRKMVEADSIRHILSIVFSKRWVTSFSLRNECLPRKCLKDIHYFMLPAEWDFVPHGISLPDKISDMVIRYNWENPSRTFVSCEKEKQTFEECFGFRNVECYGSPRMDKWLGEERLNEDEVIVFFTWRLEMRNQDVFKRTDPYFVNIERCIRTIAENCPKRKTYYVIHHEVAKCGADEYLKQLLSKYSICYLSFNDPDNVQVFNKVFRSAKYLVTDMSSVAYDFAYKNGSVPIYYQPDDFMKDHYTIDKELSEQLNLGIIVKTDNELRKALIKKSLGKQNENKRDKFFFLRDNRNTERVLNHINKEEKKNIISVSKKEKADSNRLVIFFFFDKDGIVDDYVVYYLEKLKEICKELCVVSNSFINKEGKERIYAYADKIIVRKNKGFDSGAYREAILDYGYEKISEFSELILCNYTTFGPIYPISEMLEEMSEKDCDMWGHAFWAYKDETNERFYIDDVLLHNHIMSYFTVFRKSILKSPDFAEYWNSLQLPNTYKEAVTHHENKCTLFFQRKGYAVEAYMPDYYFDNSAVFDAFEQVVENRSPFIKRRVFFTDDKGKLLRKMNKGTVDELLKYVDKETDYDVNLIIKNLQRTQ